MGKHGSIHSLISEFSCDPDVQKVSVNSTLNKRYIRDDDKCLVDDGEKRETSDEDRNKTNDGQERNTEGEKSRPDDGSIFSKSVENLALKKKIGKAFIICNQHKDSTHGKLRLEALKNAMKAFEEYFAFEVTSNNC